MKDSPLITPEMGAEAALEVSERNRQALDKCGITDEYLNQILKKLLIAKVRKPMIVRSGRDFEEEEAAGSNGNGRKKRKQHNVAVLYEGRTILSQRGSYREIVLEHTQNDNTTQCRAVDMAQKMRGNMPAEKRELSGSVGLVNADKLIEALEKASAARNGTTAGNGPDSPGE